MQALSNLAHGAPASALIRALMPDTSPMESWLRREHGALTLALRQPGVFASGSTLAPICAARL